MSAMEGRGWETLALALCPAHSMDETKFHPQPHHTKKPNPPPKKKSQQNNPPPPIDPPPDKNDQAAGLITESPSRKARLRSAPSGSRGQPRLPPRSSGGPCPGHFSAFLRMAFQPAAGAVTAISLVRKQRLREVRRLPPLPPSLPQQIALRNLPSFRG